jgi:hypothetical protein
MCLLREGDLINSDLKGDTKMCAESIQVLLSSVTPEIIHSFNYLAGALLERQPSQDSRISQPFYLVWK